jgi:ferritin-like metal-binding protein YciE
MQKKKSTHTTLQSSQLMKLFEDQLKDMLWAEKAITRAIPKMIRNATSVELIDTLVEHLDETHEQVERLNLIFASIDKRPVAKKCDAMEGLIKEAESIMEGCEPGAMCDAGIIMADQKIEHYEIASYGTLRQFAEMLGLTEAETLLEASLNEEKAADVSLSEIAQCINLEAAEEDVETMSSANSQPH